MEPTISPIAACAPRRVTAVGLCFLAVLVAAPGCQLTAFTVSQDIPAQTIPGDPGGELPPLSNQQIDLNGQIQAQTTGGVGSVKLRSLSLTITAGDDWSFLTSMDVYVGSSQPGSSLQPVRVATIANPGAVSTLDFTVFDVELVSYINEGAALSAVVSGAAPADDTTYSGVAVFTVNPL